MKKILYIISGVLFLLIGFIGLLLPIIPQIPFFILSVFLLAKGSERFNVWFRGTNVYKKYLYKYVK